jgi:hypothetical protein
MNSDGTKVIVGAYMKDAPSNSEGVAYVFTYDGSNWDTGTRIGNGVGVNDAFGHSVSVSGDGTKVIVGSPWEDIGGLGNAGAAYIFTYNSSSSNWDAGTKIVASDKAVNDQFGYSVSMSSDGTKVIVGAKGAGTGGAAYIFTYNSSSSNWGTGTKIVALNSGDEFGISVSMNSDGTKVVVGAHYHTTSAGWGAGGAYIFTYDSSSSNWGTGTEILASGGLQQDYFGTSVSINSDGTKVIVGSPYGNAGGLNDSGYAYIFTYDGSNWDTGADIMAFDKAASDKFGHSVDMSSDGTKVIVGAYQEDPSGVDGAGSAYLFTYDGSNWDTGTKIVAFDAENYDYFGRTVSISGNGAKVIVGADSEDRPSLGDAGAAYIFDYQATELFDTETQVFTVTGTGIVSGSTVQLEGADGSLYSVSNVTPNAAGTQVTFKMGSEGVEFPPSAMSTNTSITGYTASASYNSSTAWKAFDDVVSTGDYWEAGPNNATVGYDYDSPYLAGLDSAATQDISGTTHRGHWIQLQIPNPVVLSRAVIGSTQSGYQHGQFVILGSNDNANWTFLHADQNLPTTLSTNVTTLSAGSTEAFSYFRVVIKSKGAGSVNYDIKLNNVQFFGGSGSWDLAQQPYKVKVSSTSGLIGTSTAAIGFPVGWTSPAAGANLDFETASSGTQTLVGTDGGGGTNRKFTVVSTGVNALPSPLTLTEAGIIAGQITAEGTTSVTFRLTDIGSGLFTDRAINIVGVSQLYAFTSHTFTDAGAGATRINKTDSSGGGWNAGPTITQLTTAYTPTWTDYTSNLNVTTRGIQEWPVPKTGSYTIKAAGAGGGYASSAAMRGIEMTGTFTLTKGDTVRIIVGQSTPGGSGAAGDASHGGGGGSFVYYNATDTYPILVAGGGGGIWYAPGYNGGALTASDGQSGTSGGAAATTGGTAGANGNGATGNGGYAGGGAGRLTDGSDGANAGGIGGGHAPRNGGEGGRTYQTAPGGFGGGGSTHGNHGGGGGGGGYSGGAAARDTGSLTNALAGGGGSYGGTATGVYNQGQGYVIITKN